MEVKFKGRQARRKLGAVRILSRTVTVVSDGLEYEMDQGHAEILTKDMGIDEGGMGVVTPGSNGYGGARRDGRRERE